MNTSIIGLSSSKKRMIFRVKNRILIFSISVSLIYYIYIYIYIKDLSKYHITNNSTPPT